jgi:hypothetical protein
VIIRWLENRNGAEVGTYHAALFAHLFVCSMYERLSLLIALNSCASWLPPALHCEATIVFLFPEIENDTLIHVCHTYSLLGTGPSDAIICQGNCSEFVTAVTYLSRLLRICHRRKKTKSVGGKYLVILVDSIIQCVYYKFILQVFL